ncbi:MAG: hemerythrin domain-containing protein [Steroidobacteraceae bacterium]
MLLEEHLAFGDLFARHQEALLDRRFEHAASLLEAYTERLRAHIAYEERHMLPQCASRGATRWPPKDYLAEHRRIEQLLAKASDRLRHGAQRGITTAVLITILDEERTLKRLVEHHHEREEAALFQEVYRAGPEPLDRIAAGRPP